MTLSQFSALKVKYMNCQLLGIDQTNQQVEHLVLTRSYFGYAWFPAFIDC